MLIEVDYPKEKALIEQLKKRQDAEAKRLLRFLSMPDLTRAPGSPLKEIVKRVKETSSLKDFDDIRVPEIVPTRVLFDLFNMPPGHPARSKSDTYYVDQEHVLITHDTVMWYYYFEHASIKEKMKRGEDLGVVCYAKVYRKDEIDRRHMNVFHQFGGLYLTRDEKGTVTMDDLQNVLGEIAQSIFGKDAEYNFTPETFPYTDPSCEMNIKVKGEWVEMVGSGLPRKDVLLNFGVSGYNGWAFGFGLERLAMASLELPDIRLLWSEDPRIKKQLKLGQKFKEVSKYPPIVRDISFVVGRDFVPNDYFDLIWDIAGRNLVEEVKLLDKYEDEEKFGKDKVSYTYRIVYRSMERTLVSSEVDILQDQIYRETARQFKAQLR